jgi:riboflavin synthase
MFTGLVETMGQIVKVFNQHPGCRLTISLDESLWRDIAIGDSISINGCCLTVVQIDAPNLLDFEAGEETLSRTNLGQFAIGDRVNLERSLAVGDRMGGHFVTGHVDALSTILAIEPDPPWAKYWFSLPSELSRQVVSKGSITVDGISLTVVDALSDRFSVALIPHTLSVTTLGRRQLGQQVNLETDVLAKYIERQLGERQTWLNDKPTDT